MPLKLVHCAAAPGPRQVISPLVLSDRLISLAQDADRAGLCAAAGRLLEAACAVLDAPDAG